MQKQNTLHYVFCPNALKSHFNLAFILHVELMLVTASVNEHMDTVGFCS